MHHRPRLSLPIAATLVAGVAGCPAQEELCLLRSLAAVHARENGETTAALSGLDDAASAASHVLEPRLQAKLTARVARLRDRTAPGYRAALRQVVDAVVTFGERYRSTGRATLAREFLAAAAPFDERAAASLATLANRTPTGPPRAAGRAGDRAAFLAAVAAGDRARVAGDDATAHRHYTHAAELWSELPVDPDRQTRLIERLQRYWHEYTYYRIYDRDDGELRRLRARQFLGPKLALTARPRPAAGDAPNYRVAALIVRDTRVQWTESGTTRREALHLDDAALGRYRANWELAMDAIEHYARGRVRIDTDWIELDGVTLTGLHVDRWRGLVDTRHLDPAALRPPPDEALAQAVADHDAIVFVWPRGEAARAYGGGPRRLPHRDGPLPLRGCVLSMPREAATCMHEFLHNIERRATLARVHGPQSGWFEVFDGHALNDEVEYYAWIAASIEDWSAARFVNRRRRR